MNQKTALHALFLAHLKPFLSRTEQSTEEGGILTLIFSGFNSYRRSEVAAAINTAAGEDVAAPAATARELTINTVRLGEILEAVDKQKAFLAAMQPFAPETKMVGSRSSPSTNPVIDGHLVDLARRGVIHRDEDPDKAGGASSPRR